MAIVAKTFDLSLVLLFLASLILSRYFAGYPPPL